MRANRSLLFAVLVGLFVSSAEAEDVTSWHTYRDTTATTLGGQGSNDPVIGSTSSSANSSFVIGYFTPVTLSNVGDTVMLKFGVHFNDATGMNNSGDNFRYALFDENGEARDTADTFATAGTANTDNYRGYWFGTKSGTGTGSGGSIRERTATLVTGQNAFAATGMNAPSAPSLGAVGGGSVTLASDVNGNGAGADYIGTMILTRTASGIDLNGTFAGSNTANVNTFAASDTTAPTSFTFGAVGFLIGNGLSVDQATFTNVEIVPEPAGAAVLIVGALALRRSRRYRSSCSHHSRNS